MNPKLRLCNIIIAATLTCVCAPSLAGEKDELALVLKQLDQVQAALERARVVAVQEGRDSRFYFDYRRATQDVVTMKEGISRYLEPSRAQPQPVQSVTGQYRQERAQ